ncbi:MAG: tRNA pseudouridine38-40 synthase [Hyphomicrobiaceae bacterium]|jgi:tRNA pseudouridine38-40 synthase
MRAKGVVEYLGAGFCGWQIQDNAYSVQQAIEEALAIAARVPCRLAAAGRTDAGVHARGQVIGFDLPDGTDLYRLLAALNALVPNEIAITSLEEVPADFDARRQATMRSYSYVIMNQRPASPFWRDRCWTFPAPLETDRLNEIAAHLIGTHDFTAFRAADCPASKPVRTINESFWTRDGSLLIYRIEAKAFLKQMVRVLVGSMVDVALGNLDEREFVRLLDEGGMRAKAGRTAPARGLTLERVDYD